MEVAQPGKFENQCAIDRQRKEGRVVEHEAEAVWLLGVDLAEVVAARLGW